MSSTYKVFKSILLFSFLTLWTSIDAQNWQNSSERYADAHKKYENATCPILKDSIKHFVYFSRDRVEIINHPLLSHSQFISLILIAVMGFFYTRFLRKAKGGI